MNRTTGDIPRNTRGFTLLEVLLVLVIIAVILPVLYSFVSSANESLQEQLAAQQFKMVMGATENYIAGEWGSLIGSIPTGGKQSVSFSTIQAAGYAPPQLNSAPKNVWHQGYKIYLIRGSGPNANNITALVLTKGGQGKNAVDHFNASEVPGAAAMIGGHGGFTGYNGGPSSIPGPNFALGLNATWKVDMGALGISSPGGGHLAGLLYYDQGKLASNYLYRFQIAGQPDLNKMHTDLDMGGNNINNANKVNDQYTDSQKTSTAKAFNLHNGCWDCVVSATDKGNNTHDLIGTYYGWDPNGVYIAGNNKTNSSSKTDAIYAGGQGSDLPFISNGTVIGKNGVTDSQGAWLSLEPRNMVIATQDQFIPAPNCNNSTPLGTESPVIYAAPVFYTGTATGPGDTIGGVQAYATSAAGGWHVHLRVYARHGSAGGTPGWVKPQGRYGQMLVITRCAI